MDRSSNTEFWGRRSPLPFT